MPESPILRLEGVTKNYPGVIALDNVNFELRPSEIHALIGENGAGKSTLIKILSGCINRNSGEIFLNGDRIGNLDPRSSKSLGIGVIYQELILIPYLTVVENIFLGKELTKNGFRDIHKMKEEAKSISKLLGIDLDPMTQVNKLSIAQQQMVEISKALITKVKILIMDEPSASLSTTEIDKMFEIMRTLKAQGVSIIYVSHRLEEIFEITDRVTVLRDGQYIKTLNTDETNRDELISLMVGREIVGYYPPADYSAGEEILRVEKLSNYKVKNINFNLNKNEILGIAGLVGAGRTETVRAIFGADPIYEGKVFINDKEISLDSPENVIDQGIGLIPEDRKQHGLLLNLNVRENVTFSVLKELSRNGLIRKKKEDVVIDKLIKELRIKCVSDRQMVVNLSGGNQQKVVVAKWLAKDCDILIVDEPTRGIDVGAKHEIYELLRTLAKEGKAIIMISSEMPELMNIADRIIVMCEGEIKGELMPDQYSQEKILGLACLD